jgi:hypothetical protein
MSPNSDVVRGTISSAAFAGQQFVIGCWSSSPVGPIGDVMWSLPDGTRRLLTSSEREADFICQIYEFDEVCIAPLDVLSDGLVTTVSSRELSLELRGGFAWRLPPRPLWVTRWIESPVAKALMGVETYGISPRGRREWYQASSCRWVKTAHAKVNGAELGEPQRFGGPMNVGFSNPPKRPSIVSLSVTIRTG